MSIEDEVFLKYTPIYKELEKYGFKHIGKKYVFEKIFYHGSFRTKIEVCSNGNVNGTVYDTENDDVFIPLRVENHEGAFVGEVREAYRQILADIRDKCFNKNYFVTTQGNRIADLIYQKYGDQPVFMWEDYPTFGVYKNPETNKWYGLIMYIPRTKLTEPCEDFVEVINLKLDKDEIQGLLKKDGFYPAYHMNKKLWITITLDDTLEDKEIFRYIEESFSYTVKKKKSLDKTNTKRQK